MSGHHDHRRGRSGSGFMTCADGRVRWGLYGAAGVLFRACDGEGVWRFLLQHRGAMTHEGGTWAIPGGAIDEEEDPIDGALREATEELGDLPPHQIEEIHEDRVTDDWCYTTVIATVDEPFGQSIESWETEEVRWVTVAEIEDLPLHPGFAAALPALLRKALR